MTLGDIIKITHPDIMVGEQYLVIMTRRGKMIACNHREREKWGPYADREVIKIRANGLNEFAVFLEDPADKVEDTQIPGQMDISDYGIERG